ncbi:histidine phosphatase superfamily [Xylaria arbuscula]|nr:histidine phosphatase superfamily [Xylaria arbuscula]
MPPIIDIIRSAETPDKTFEHDPDITSHGEYQVFLFKYSYPYHYKITHIVSSPMRRCIRTTVEAFGETLTRGKQMMLLPELQPIGASPYDTGRSPRALEALFRPCIDSSMIDSRWSDKTTGSRFAPDVALIEERARKARVFLRELAQSGPEDAHIPVITHGSFAHFLTENYAGLSLQQYTTFQDVGMRSFEFVDLLGDDRDAKMIETADSLAKSKLPRFEDLDDVEKSRLKMCAVMGVERQKTSNSQV